MTVKRLNDMEQFAGELTLRAIAIIVAHAFVGWALCGAIMGIGLSVASEETTLIVHAIGAPIIFTAVSLSYFTRFNFTSPLRTAIAFVSFVILTDFFLVSLVINRNLEMFESFIGSWLPFILIFSSTYMTGLYVTNRIGTDTDERRVHAAKYR